MMNQGVVSMAIWRGLLVDRICILVVIQSKVLYHQTESQLYKFAPHKSEWVPTGDIKVFQEKYLKRLDYYAQYGYAKGSKRKIAEIKVGANFLFGGKVLHRYLSLTLYPSQFNTGEFETFKTALNLVMPEFNYPKLFHTGNVNCLELAIDSLTHRHHSFLPYRKCCRDSGIWNEDDGHLGTTYLGSVASGLRFAIYDKRKQLIDGGKGPITQILPHTRFEARMRHLGVTALELVHLENPFLKLGIADLNKAQAFSDHQDWLEFICESLYLGVPLALFLRPEKRKTFGKMLSNLQVPWWRPEQQWQGLAKALTVIAP
jgi:hypothetical protein